jgi:RNA polymerase sigma-70 factor (ECF subfamily)
MERQSRAGGEAAPSGGLAARDAQPGEQPAEHDLALMAAVQRGDREALGALYDRHAPLLLALALRLLGEDRAAADEALHDLFVEVWHQARNFEAGRGLSVRGFLIGRMRALALARRGEANVAPAAMTRELSGLPAELAAVLDLTYFGGLSVAAAAERLGLPSGLVKDRLGRALAWLRQQVRPEETTS